MSMRRQLSWRARQGSQRLKEEGRRAAVSCWDDFTTARLMSLKFTFFILMAGIQCVTPFLPLFLRSLGLTVQEAGFIFALSPILPIFAPFLASIIAYRLTNFRCVLVFTVALSGFVALTNIAIPVARTTPKHSDTLSFSVTCGSTFILTPILTKDDKCDFLEKTVTIAAVKATNCGYMCSPPAISLPQAILKDTKKLKAKQTASPTLHHICKIEGGKEKVVEQKCFRKNLNKTLNYENMSKVFQINNLIMQVSKSQSKIGFPVENYTMVPEAVRSFECQTGKVPKKVSIPRLVISEDIHLESNDSVTCDFHCQASVPHNTTCEKLNLSTEHHVSLTFWFFVAVNVLSKFLIGLTYALLEAAVIPILKERNHEYRVQKNYGCFGGMIFAPLTGFIIDYFGKGDHYTDYFVMFVMYCAFKLMCALILVQMEMRFRVRTKTISNNVCRVFANCEAILLFLIVFIAGMCYGFIENFLPWHLVEIGSPRWFIGLLTTIASLAALPFVAFSGSICRMFGFFQSIAFGLVCYSIRFIGYSLVQEWYWCAPFEVLEGVTTGLLIRAAEEYGGQLFPKYKDASLHRVLTACHYCFGKSAGSLLGSFLMATFNARLAFQIFSGLSLISAFFYYLLGKLVIMPRQTKQLKRKQAVMNMPIETISRKEYKKQNKLSSLPEMEESRTLMRKKRQSPRPPSKENVPAVEENGTLNETQMTDLPPDDEPTQNSIDDTLPVHNTSSDDSQDPKQEDPPPQSSNDEDVSAQNKVNEDLSGENQPTEESSAQAKTEDTPEDNPKESPSDTQVHTENETQKT